MPRRGEFKARVKRTCLGCGAHFTTHPSNAARKYCRWPCRRAHMVGPNAPNAGGGAWMCGPRNPNWKGGVSALGIARTTEGEHRRWRRRVLARDERVCQLCGACDVPVRAHHLVEWAAAPLLRFVVENGVTLCEPCHRFGHCRGVELCVVPPRRQRDVVLAGRRLWLTASCRNMSEAAWRLLVELSARLAEYGVLPERMARRLA